MPMHSSRKRAIIIGAGPAGLTAALEFCREGSIQPIVLEANHRIGGISCTIEHNGNRMDIGGHRFFSKSDVVMDWWSKIMPIAKDGEDHEFSIRYQNQDRKVCTAEASRKRPAPMDPDCVMLVRPRKSRIYFMRQFFDYPLSLSPGTLGRLGMFRTLRILVSYLYAQIAQRKPEKSLEDFLINRFGHELYGTFFKSYTEKVWGVPCAQISAAWGAQRIKGLSLKKAVSHFFQKAFTRKKSGDIRQKDSETSLIEKFLYPKFGPGQLWERVAELVREEGGEIRLGWKVAKLHVRKERNDAEVVTAIDAICPTGEIVRLEGDYFFSTMPVRELLRAIDVQPPAEIQAISDGLQYRDFITVGLLVDRLLITEPDGAPVKDTWIYIQEPDVQLGRLQIFNNWSPHLVADPNKVWIGLEYFCYDRDELWRKSEEEFVKFAIAEVAKIGIVDPREVRDSCVIHVPKTYPAYFGTYEQFDKVVDYMERYENLFLVGRNGMHKYNNQDHSMLTAMAAVDNILNRVKSKKNLWEINTEQEYHEQKSARSETAKPSQGVGTEDANKEYAA